MRLNKLFSQLVFFASIAVLTSSLSAQGFMKNLGTRGFEMSMEMTPTSDGNYVTVGPVTRRPNVGRLRVHFDPSWSPVPPQ